MKFKRSKLFGSIFFVMTVLGLLSLMSCGNQPPANSKIHENVKITVLDAYIERGVNYELVSVRLIAMTSIRPYPIVIFVNPSLGIIDEITLERMYKTVENFTFKAKRLSEDLNIENSMAFYLEGRDIVLFPNNNVDLKSGYSVINDDMTPITMPGNKAGVKHQTGNGQGGASAVNTNTVNINVGDGKERH